MIDSKLIGLIRDNLTKPSIERELLQKTSVLSINKLTKTKCKLSVISLTSLLATCQPSYANNVKVQQRVNTNNSKVYIRVNSKSEESSQLAKINQLSFFDSFNCIDKVAVTGNNLKQERQNLFTTVLQHHTLVDVFLCLSFASCLFAGELRLAALWWGGHRNKPLEANTVCRCCNGSEPPYRPTFRANNQNMFNRDLLPNPQAYELKRKKDKGHVATTTQPFKH